MSSGQESQIFLCSGESIARMIQVQYHPTNFGTCKMSGSEMARLSVEEEKKKSTLLLSNVSQESLIILNLQQ